MILYEVYIIQALRVLAKKEQVRSKVNIQMGHLVIHTQRVPRTGLEDLNIVLPKDRFHFLVFKSVLGTWLSCKYFDGRLQHSSKKAESYLKFELIKVTSISIAV